ncbi:aminotransferase class III-fold pyridoxal phosphate-dependent enzyme [Bartonella sp. HY406]|uniref:aminotransferase class III-fold pyridoxal phosphate-dependent enzyme n=1 Tax=Bartonella sp. HY406 TaxID=2979331 RepID=UPI0021CABBCA|nr:aminotransferase class III-fold pyridoxal phosphate-dependent enzyme [Bartonella sp. HY406]UXN02777.1 aminotransferase class III-fold pyridoxal phosphate-dependent enzyme [Bartonella sp. HY406]
MNSHNDMKNTVDPLLYPFTDPENLKKFPPIVITGGKGVYVTDNHGKSYIDGQAGLWNVNVGHGREEIKEAIRQQLDKLSYYSLFAGSSNQPSLDLSNRLVEMTAQEDMGACFFSSGGSEANEAAFKLVRQYWRLKGEPKRTHIISLKNAYHGVTLGALSAIGSRYYRENFEPLLSWFSQVETPHLYRNPFGIKNHEELGTLCLDLMEREILYKGPANVAAIIAEPVQGAGGIIVPPKNYWPGLRQLCDKYGILLISDEVVTGFGRLGSMLGCRHWGVRPDIMSFAKGINSGYVPLGVTMMSREIAHTFETIDTPNPSIHGFVHGNTYSGHPLACASALANLKIIEDENLTQKAGDVGQYFIDRLKDLQTRHENIGDVRGCGLMIGVEMVADREHKTPFQPSDYFGARIADYCRDHGVLIRNLADTFIISPPFILEKEHVDIMVDTFDAGIKSVAK